MTAQPIRLALAGLFAAIVTVTLFLFMQQLVSTGGKVLGELDPIQGIRFGPVEIPDDVVARSRRKPERPPPSQDPPPPPRMSLSPTREPEPLLPRMEMPVLDVPLTGGAGLYLGNFQQVDSTEEGDVSPVVVIRPMYPREAALSGIEGWVKVEFTITETGTVTDARVIDAQPARIFNREAIRAILKWKFKPRVIDGVAVERRATQTIDFTLQEPGVR